MIALPGAERRNALRHLIGAWMLVAPAVFFATSSLATPPPEATPHSPSDGIRFGTEQLLASVPEGWLIVSAVNEPGLRIAEYANPSSLTPDQVDSLRLEAQTGDPLPDPIEFMRAARDTLHENCKGFIDHPIFAGFENGYPTSVHLMLCRERINPAQGLIRMVKAIQGQDAFYVVSRSRHAAPFEADSEPLGFAEMAGWSAWISAIGLCDPGAPEHPCPEPAPDAAPAQAPPAASER